MSQLQALEADRQQSGAVLEGVRDPAVAVQRRRTAGVFAGRVVVLAAVLGVWQYYGSRPGGELSISTPLHVIEAFFRTISDGSLTNDLKATGIEVGLGFVIGAGGGLVLGAAAATSEFLARVLDPYIIAIYGTPKIAFAPILVVWLGIGLAPKVALSALLVFFLVFYSTYQGIRSVDPNRINALRLMGAGPLQLRRLVIFPGARGSIFLGLKLGVPQALVGAIVGEFISSTRGIGYSIQYATTRLDTAAVFSGLFVLMTISLTLNGVVNAASRKKGLDS
jgi:NitT/TauT family transport system permease protein